MIPRGLASALPSPSQGNCPGVNSSPGMNQLPLLEHGLGTWVSIQPGHSVQLRSGEQLQQCTSQPLQMSLCDWLGAAISAGHTNPCWAPCLPRELLPRAAHGSGNPRTRESRPRSPEHQPSSCWVSVCSSSSLNLFPFFTVPCHSENWLRSHDGGYDERWSCRTSPKLQIEKVQNLSARGRD